MNKRAIIPLVAGLCVGGFALKMTFDTIGKAKAGQTAMVKIWAAATDIPRGEQIDENMLKAIAFPATAVPAGAITDKKKALGRVPKITAPGGLPILEAMLSPEGTPPGLLVPPGFRGVAVKIDESSGVDNHLWPGCRVDVVGYFNVNRNGRQETVARTLIENIEVGAVGAQIAMSTNDEEKSGKSSSAPKAARAVTLFVPPDKVPTLHLAEQRGKIKLSMRNAEDANNLAKPSNISESQVLGRRGGAEEDEDEDGEDTRAAGKREPVDLRKGFLGAMVKNLFAPAAAGTQPGAAPPAGSQGPSSVWEVVVWNGAAKEILRWAGPNSRQQIGEGGIQPMPPPDSTPGTYPGAPAPPPPAEEEPANPTTEESPE
ncbi:hypothetical protein RAS1_12100 [Phycisphaerae bacterium RAS1]|nr:hypothetical protein RAS1_12100 [Phycisphaerae bacterium RAS1]